MSERIRNFADKYLNKFMSRKLFTLILSTVLLLNGVIDSEVWATIACVYIGSEGVRDSVIAYRQKEVSQSYVEHSNTKD